jgi:hypothetical protein
MNTNYTKKSVSIFTGGLRPLVRTHYIRKTCKHISNYQWDYTRGLRPSILYETCNPISNYRGGVVQGLVNYGIYGVTGLSVNGSFVDNLYCIYAAELSNIEYMYTILHVFS